MQVFIDTNVFLSFYRYTRRDLKSLEKLVKLIEENSITLIITEQVITEFYRNRENTILDSINNFSFKNSLIPSIFDGYSESKELHEALERTKKLKDIIENQLRIDIINKKLQADILIEKIFSIADVLEITDIVIEKARNRYTIGNPPGKKGSFGDAINWEALLLNKNHNDLVFISEDKDYKSNFDDNKINNFLEMEWNNYTNSSIILYKGINDFLKIHLPDINLIDQNEKNKLIMKLSNSRNEKTATIIINLLKEYDSYSGEEINIILKTITEHKDFPSIAINDNNKRFLQNLHHMAVSINHTIDRTILASLKFKSIIPREYSDFISYDDEARGGSFDTFF